MSNINQQGDKAKSVWNQYKNDFFKIILIAIPFILATLIGSPINTDKLLITVLTIVIMLVFLFVVLYIFNISKNKEILDITNKTNQETTNLLSEFKSELNHQIKDFKNFNDKYEEHLKQYSEWLYSSERLALFEKEICASSLKDIWVASSNLKFETENSPFLNAIKDNIDEGINYTYVIPESLRDEASEKLEHLEEYAKNKKGSIKFKYIENNKKDLFLFLSNIVIYKSSRRIVFKELVQNENDAFTNPWQKINPNRKDFQLLYSKFK